MCIARTGDLIAAASADGGAESLCAAVRDRLAVDPSTNAPRVYFRAGRNAIADIVAGLCRAATTFPERSSV